MAHFELSFCIWCTVGVQKHLLHVDNKLSQCLLKRPFFPPLNCLGLFVKNQLTIKFRVHFWVHNSIPLKYMSILKYLLWKNLFINYNIYRKEPNFKCIFLKKFCKWMQLCSQHPDLEIKHYYFPTKLLLFSHCPPKVHTLLTFITTDQFYLFLNYI